MFLPDILLIILPSGLHCVTGEHGEGRQGLLSRYVGGVLLQTNHSDNIRNMTRHVETT